MGYVGDSFATVVSEARVAGITAARARFMTLVRRSSLLPGMPDAFDRAPLQ